MTTGRINQVSQSPPTSALVMHDMSLLRTDAHPSLKQWSALGELTRGTTLHCKVLHTSVLLNLLAHTQGTQPPYKLYNCIAQTCVTNAAAEASAFFILRIFLSEFKYTSFTCLHRKCLHSHSLKLSIPHLKVWIQKHRLRLANGEIQKLEKGVRPLGCPSGQRTLPIGWKMRSNDQTFRF